VAKAKPVAPTSHCLPPSVANGEQRAWCGEIIAPAVIDARVLRRRIAWLATACLVHRYVGETTAAKPAPDFPRLLWEIDHTLGGQAYRWLGLPSPDQPRIVPKPRHQLTEREVDLRGLAAAILNDTLNFEEWNKFGLAFYAASDGSGEGFIVFDDFSAKCSAKYDPHYTEQRWRDYRRSPPTRIGVGYLMAAAHRAGWRRGK